MRGLEVEGANANVVRKTGAGFWGGLLLGSQGGFWAVALGVMLD